MTSEPEWHAREYTDLVKAAESDSEMVEKLTTFKTLLRQGKRPIFERRIVGLGTIEYRVRDRDA
jgi:hypothetical protein